MIRLEPDETILLVMRRHWFVLSGHLALLVAFLAVPFLGISLITYFSPALAAPPLLPYLLFFMALYLLGLLLYALIIWMEYYLDAWIITNRRIIDIEQFGIFHRQISEIALERVENVTIEVSGVMATMLHFGNIKLETAGEGEFNITMVQDYDIAKNLILKYSRRADTAPAYAPGPSRQNPNHE